MKIALISPYDFNTPGGVNDHISNLHLNLIDRGIDSHIIAPLSGRNVHLPPNFIAFGNTIPFPTGGSVARISLSTNTYFKIKTFLKNADYDILHIHEPFAGTLTMGAMLSNTKSLKIATFHSYKGSYLYALTPNVLLNRYFKNLNGHIAVSMPAMEYVNKHLKANYEIIPNGINLNDNEPALPIDSFKDGKLNILFLGRMDKRKGLSYLINAYCDLKLKYDDLRLIVAGPGAMDTDCIKIIGARNPKDLIILGEVSHQEKSTIYKNADIFCAPSTGQESFGIVLLEAMKAELPIVATNIEGYKSVVQDGKEALLCDPKSVKGLRICLEQMINSKDLRNTLIYEGKNTVGQYSWYKITDTLLNYYQQIRCSIKNN